MKQVVNFIITSIVIWVASYFFPGLVQVSGIGAIILTTLLISAVSIPVVLILMLFAIKAFYAAADIGASKWMLIATWVGLLFSALLTVLIAVYIASGIIPGFKVIGFLPKLILAFAITTIRIPEKTSNN